MAVPLPEKFVVLPPRISVIGGGGHAGSVADIAVDHPAGLQLQAVGAAGEENGIGAHCASVAVKTAGNRAGIDDGLVAAANADAANSATCRKTW